MSLKELYYKSGTKPESEQTVKIYLDDNRYEPDGWVRTFTAQQTIDLLKHNKVDKISLDHDLGHNVKLRYGGTVDLYDVETGNGYDVLLWIEEQVATTNYIPPEINIHTGNPSAAGKMWASVQSIKELTEKRNNT